MAHIEDRWMKTGPSGRKVKTERHGAGLRWLAVWNERDGRRRKRGFSTKDAAQAHLDEVAHAVRSGTYIAPERGRILFRDMADLWLVEQVHQRNTSLATIDRRLRLTILPALGHLPLEDIDRSTVQAAVTSWSKTYAPTTVQLAYVYTAGIFKTAVHDRRIQQSPCLRINLPGVEKSLVIPPTPGQVQAFLEAVWTPYKAMVVFVAAAGTRGGETRGLTWDRITENEGGARVLIDRQLVGPGPTWGPPKTDDSYRDFSIGKSTLAALGPRRDGLVFTGRLGGPINRNAAGEAWRHAAKVVDIPGRGWHQLRHFHASLLIAGGASPVAVASRLGHKDATETLRTYAHLWEDDDQRMRDASDGIITLEPPQSPQSDIIPGQSVA